MAIIPPDETSALRKSIHDLRIAVGALRDQVKSLEAEVHSMAERLAPVEQQAAAEEEARRKRQGRAELAAELAAAGVDVPADFLSGSDIPTAVRARARSGWLWDAVELAGTSGGTRVLVAFVAVLLGPDAVRMLATVVDVWREPTPIVVPVQPAAETVLPSQGPPSVDPLGLQDDSPVSPRPTL